MDQAIESELVLDGIVTVVDAKNISNNVKFVEKGGNVSEVIKQIAVADVLLVNKADLVSRDEVKRIENEIRGMNSSCKVYVTEHSRLDVSVILDLHAYDSRKLDCGVESHLKSHLDEGMSSVTLVFGGRAEKSSWDECLQRLLWEGVEVGGEKMEVYRVKGFLMTLENAVLFVQAVFEIYELEVASGCEERENKLVIIGRKLDKDALKRMFEETVSRNRNKLGQIEL